MSTDTATPVKKRRKPPTERLHIVIKRSVADAIVKAAALSDLAVSAYIAKAAEKAATALLLERGLCPECKQPVAQHKTAA